MAENFGKRILQAFRGQDATAPPVVETRSHDIPDKVYIEKEGSYSEWSIQEPAALKESLYSILNGFYGPQNFIELFYALPEVFAPVHEIASRVADCNWQLCKDWNDEVDYKDKDFNRLFTRPNPLMSMKEFVYQAVCYEILTGRELFFFNKPSTLPDEYRSVLYWWNLPAHKAYIEMKKGVDPYTATALEDFVQRYRLPQHGGQRYFEPKQILPILHLCLEKGYDLNATKPMLMGAEKAIRNLIPVYEARGIIYIKRGAMGFLVSRKGDESGTVALTPKEKASVAKTVNDMYGLQGNKNTIGVTEQPIDFVKTSMSIAEMQPFEETLADAVAIYKVLRVPRHLVPSKDTSTYANAAADMKSFYSDVIIPWAKRYAEAWTNYLQLVNFRRYIRADFSHVDVLQENKKEAAEVEKTLIENANTLYEKGVIKKNERNAKLGFASVPDGDVYVGEGDNQDPLAVQIGVGGVQAFVDTMANTNIAPEAKKHALIVLFGIAEADAEKLVVEKEPEPTADPIDNQNPKDNETAS